MESISMGIMVNAVKALLYYFHERGWNLVSWGRSERKAGLFYLERRYAEEMIAHAREETPNECCGLLAGADGRVTRLYRVTNIERSSTHYEADPKQILHILKEVEERGWELIGIYHSHTHTSAYPSAADLELAFWPDSLYFIISLSDAEPAIRAFKIIDGQIEEEPVEIVHDKVKR